MAEMNSNQAATVAAGKKLRPVDSFGRQRVLVATLPTTYAAPAINDTILLGTVPVGSRFLTGGKVVLGGAGTADSTLSIGVRNAVTKEVIDADGIAVTADASAAATVAADTGALITDGTDHVMDVTVEVYATVLGAVLKANQQVRFEIPYVTD